MTETAPRSEHPPIMSIRENSIDFDAVFTGLRELFHQHRAPVVDLIEAQTSDPFKVLVATILSARTKDETTTMVTQKLFARVNAPEDLERLSVPELEELVHPAGFFRNKAKHLHELPRVLREEFDGEIPRTIEGLTRLPGVGRKTANLVLAIGFRIPAVCVDVHVHRIMNRLGYVDTKTPLETEMALREKMPQKYWLEFNSYFVSFGQNLCHPRNPRCDRCPIYRHCARIGVITKYPRESE